MTSKWKPLLPLTRYEVGDLVKTSEDSITRPFNVHRVVRAGTTDDLKLFYEWQYLIEMNRPIGFYDMWDCGEVRFLISTHKDDYVES